MRYCTNIPFWLITLCGYAVFHSHVLFHHITNQIILCPIGHILLVPHDLSRLECARWSSPIRKIVVLCISPLHLLSALVTSKRLAGSISGNVADYITELARRVRAEAMEAGKFGVCDVRLGLGSLLGGCRCWLGCGLRWSGLGPGLWLRMWLATKGKVGQFLRAMMRLDMASLKAEMNAHSIFGTWGEDSHGLKTWLESTATPLSPWEGLNEGCQIMAGKVEVGLGCDDMFYVYLAVWSDILLCGHRQKLVSLYIFASFSPVEISHDHATYTQTISHC